VGYTTHKKMHQAIMDRDYEKAMEMLDSHTGVWMTSVSIK